MVCRPKDKGGLSAINLRLQNIAMLLKFLVKFYNGADLPSVHLVWNSYYQTKAPHMIMNKGSFWWRDIIELSDIFRGIAKCTVSSGTSELFWEDLWNDDLRSIK